MKYWDIKVIKQPSFRELRDRLWNVRSRLTMGVLADFATYYDNKDYRSAQKLIERLEHEYSIMVVF